MASWTPFLAEVVRGAIGLAMGEFTDVAQRALDHFSSHGEIVERSLREAHEEAWLVIEAALAGPSWWGKSRSGGGWSS